MLNSVQWFVNRLVERIIPIVGTLFSSAVETLHALGQAEQQSQLEEAARLYEADGKPDIAAALRRRAAELISDNPAARALDIYDNVAGDEQRMLPPTQRGATSELAAMPDLDRKPAKSRRKSPASRQSTASDA
jgi:hypothetical protein